MAPFATPTRPKNFRLTPRDLALLGFLARHRFVLAAPVIQWLGADRSVAYRRLAGLASLGLITQARPFSSYPSCFSITPAGLSAIASRLPAPAVELGCFRHDAALVWLWLERHPARGQRDRVLTEREMRGLDREAAAHEERYALQLPTLGPGGRPRRHYPDLVVQDHGGGCRALELELTLKSRSRLEAILTGYGAHAQIADVTYLTDRPKVARAVLTARDALGLGRRVRVQITHQSISASHPAGGWRPYPDPQEPTR